MSSKADLLLHPIRMRVIQSLHSHQQLTPKQLLEILDDIPQATLYRQLKTLLDAELIYVVDSKQIRGAKEKVYAVREENMKIPDQEIKNLTPNELTKHFMAYQSNLLKEFERYVYKNEPQNYKNDGLGFSQATLHLTDDELQQFGLELQRVIEKYDQNTPSDSRVAITFGTVNIPQIFRRNH
ncbi:helix-turn-helix domain-containing protein [Piscibacillus sp. B03]|uniref:helix-turn-helix domain-containing protein n=1 Tax=Piscibacillus sp. B03 TaxID=3457430 RepID=UPI003FCC3F8C